MTETIAAIFAHPDDQVLGCGGALAAHDVAGHPAALFGPSLVPGRLRAEAAFRD